MGCHRVRAPVIIERRTLLRASIVQVLSSRMAREARAAGTVKLLSNSHCQPDGGGCASSGLEQVQNQGPAGPADNAAHCVNGFLDFHFIVT